MEAILRQDVRLAAGGNQQAYARIVEKCQSLVCSIALAILRDVAASEEVAQEVFLAVWVGLPRLRNEASFLPWLRQLTRNQANEHLRRQWRHRQTRPLDEVVGGENGAQDPAPSVVEHAVEREQEMILNAALGEIPDESREVITLFYREGGSVEQVAGLLGLKQDAVKKRLSRGREHLKDAVQARFADVLKTSAPGAAFGVAVIGQLAIAPSAQAAAMAVATAQAKGPLHLGWLLLKGAGLGTGAALIGIIVGIRQNLARAIDDQERRELKRFAAVQISFVVAAGLASLVPWSGNTQHSYVIALPTTVLLIALLGSYAIWLPRIEARRMALERERDPIGAVARQKRERIIGIIGMTIGAIGAATGIYFGLKNITGR
jgi:RNA polymerase sigma factor (sigma-70 family)